MKMKSIAGISCHVKDLKKTAAFYKVLGFELKNSGDGVLSTRLNWSWIDFHVALKEERAEFKKEAKSVNKGAGLFLSISVDDVDAFYKMVLSKKLKPLSEPRDYPWGSREFVIRDPDGYKLVFFKRK